MATKVDRGDMCRRSSKERRISDSTISDLSDQLEFTSFNKDGSRLKASLITQTDHKRRSSSQTRRHSLATFHGTNDEVLLRGCNDSNDGELLRRRSTFRRLSQSITGILKLRRKSTGKLPEQGTDESEVRYENTYRVEPEKSNTFNAIKVQQVAMEIIEEKMKDVKYQPEICSKQSCELSYKIKNAIKALNWPRYKIICQVIIGEAKHQGVEVASRCVWDAVKDNYTCVSYYNNSLFVCAMVYWVYFE